MNARTYSAQKNTPDLTPFTRAVEAAVPDWRFPKVPPEHKAPWYGCFEFDFRLRN